ncbi:unnamed protein product [Urochloa decumbens]|uniref:Uncharacterized protein n=1 Tax=Urochloa decumbens TaxID=240449 RepID=A0ABC8VFJ4_9POAL
MVSGGSREAGKKRKKASVTAATRRDPRRGLGVAELERIRVALEVAERCYAAVPPQPAAALPPAALALHGAGNGALQLFTSDGHGHPPSHQNNGRQADQIQCAVTALPATGQAASSESSSSAYQQRRSRRRAQPRQPGQTAVPAFVDLVDSDETCGDVEELDLELKL